MDAWLKRHEKELFGDWRCWTYGEDLRLQDAESVGAPPGRVKDLKEEGLETLLLLNLDKVFPDWSLRLTAKSLKTWAGADIEAADPRGCKHVFELKYGASAKDVVDQVLAYALSTLREPNLRFFDQMPRKEMEVFVAVRVGTFWHDLRAQTLKRIGEEDEPYPQSELDMLGRNPKARGEPTVERCLETAGPHLTRLALATVAQPDWPESATDMLIHVVVPNFLSISDWAKQALARLRHRQVQVAIWEVKVTLDRVARSGTLAVRDVRLPSLSPTKRNVTKSNVPVTYAPSALLAEMHRLDLGHRSRKWRWKYGHGGELHLWAAPVARLVLQLRSSHGHFSTRCLHIRSWVDEPEYVARRRRRDRPDWTIQLDGQKRVLVDWLAGLAPPQDEPAYTQLLDPSGPAKKSKGWSAAVRGREAWCTHSVEGKTATCTIDVEGLLLCRVAEIANTAVAEYAAAIEVHRESLVPFQ